MALVMAAALPLRAEPAWVDVRGSSAFDAARAGAGTADGAACWAGETAGAFDGGTNAGNVDACIAAFDHNGQHQWTRLVGSPAYDCAAAIADDPQGNHYCAGVTRGTLHGTAGGGSGDWFLIKLDAQGAITWSQVSKNPAYDAASACATWQTNTVYLGGTLTMPGTNTTDCFIAAFSSAGTCAWLRTFGSPTDDWLVAVAADQSGNVYATGATLGAFDGQTNAGGCDVFLTKFDAAGTRLWTRLCGTADDDSAGGCACDAVGAPRIIGRTWGAFAGQTNAGLCDAFVAAYTPAGVPRWARLLGTPDHDSGTAIAAAPDAASHCAGCTYGAFAGMTNTGLADVFVARIADDGALTDLTLAGSPSNDYAAAVLYLGSDADVGVAGATEGAWPAAPARGNSDALLVRMVVPEPSVALALVIGAVAWRRHCRSGRRAH